MTYYLRLIMTKWDNIEIHVDPPILPPSNMKSPEGSIGYLPVFDSFEAFMEAFPGEVPMLIETISTENNG